MATDGWLGETTNEVASRVSKKVVVVQLLLDELPLASHSVGAQQTINVLRPSLPRCLTRAESASFRSRNDDEAEGKPDRSPHTQPLWMEVVEESGKNNDGFGRK